MDEEDFSSWKVRSQWQEDRGGIFRRLAVERRVPPVSCSPVTNPGRVSGRDCPGVAGRRRLRRGGLSLLLHPRLGPGAVSDPGTETAAAARTLLRGVKGSLAARTLPLGYRARPSEPAGLCRGVAAVFCDVVRYLSLMSIFLLRGGGPRVSAQPCDPLTVAPRLGPAARRGGENGWRSYPCGHVPINKPSDKLLLLTMALSHTT